MFPFPAPPCNVGLLFELLVGNKEHPSFGGVGAGVWIVLFSEVTLFKESVLTVL